MKHCLLLLFILFCNLGLCQNVYIPDANFKGKLLAADSGVHDNAGVGVYPNIFFNAVDTNGDGEIQYSEAEVITFLRMSFANISDLTGIERFINLTHLGCAGNNLTTIDLSQLVHLEGFGCFNNNLISLNVNNLPNLKILSCQNNQITTLDFIHNPQIEKVFCGNNQLGSLDFSNNPLLDELDCYNNPNLKTVKINNGASQLLGTQTYYNQCWSGLPNLSTICADANEVVPLTNYLNGCGIDANTIKISSNCALGVVENRLNDKNLKVIKNNNELFFLSSQQEINSIKIYDLTGKLLFEKAALAGFSANVVLNVAPQLLLVQVGFNDGSTLNEKVEF